ncbi:MAG: hypothetical protein WCT77_10940 [Bacteroidota bacterium]
MFKRIFIANTDDELPWQKIVLWWELRRLLYNIFLIFFVLLSLTVLSLIVEDLFSFFSPPFFVFIQLIIFFIFANICYTSGWIIQLVTKKEKNKFINRVKPKLFIYGLLFSCFIIFIPCFINACYTLITGERIKSVYADFTTQEPKAKDIEGDYIISENTRKQLHLPDSIANKTLIRFNPDKTFTLKYFPYHSFGKNFTEYEIVNASGKWYLEKDQEAWVLPMKYDTITSVVTNQKLNAPFNTNGFHLKKENPPYEIYIIIGDPDSWEGISLLKKHK